LNVVIGYDEVTSEGTECLSLLEGPFLHVGQLKMPDSEMNSSVFCVRTTGFERCFENAVPAIRSVIARGSGTGDYVLPACVDGIAQNLTSPDGRSSFVVDSHYLFIPFVSFGHRSETSLFTTTATATPSGRVIATDLIFTTSQFITTSPFVTSPFIIRATVMRTERVIATDLIFTTSQFITTSHFISTMIVPGAGQLSSAGLMFVTSRPFEHSGAMAEHSEGSKLVWIGVGVGSIVLLVSIAGSVLVVAHRRRALCATKEATTRDLSKSGDGHVHPLGLGLLDLDFDVEWNSPYSKSIHSKGIK
jgi:hypothetical protein